MKLGDSFKDLANKIKATEREIADKNARPGDSTKATLAIRSGLYKQIAGPTERVLKQAARSFGWKFVVIGSPKPGQRFEKGWQIYQEVSITKDMLVGIGVSMCPYYDHDKWQSSQPLKGLQLKLIWNDERPKPSKPGQYLGSVYSLYEALRERQLSSGLYHNDHDVFYFQSTQDFDEGKLATGLGSLIEYWGQK